MKLKFYAFTLAEGATHVAHWNNSRKIGGGFNHSWYNWSCCSTDYSYTYGKS